MGAVTYPDSRVAEFVNSRMVPVQMLYDAQPFASTYTVKWTPTMIVLDGEGKEHHRIVGFLPPDEFLPALLLGIGKTAFDADELDKAMADLDKIITAYPRSAAAPEAMYLRGVVQFKKSHQAGPLKEAFEQLKRDYPASEWAKRATPYGLL
ncbi:MAG TPA: thioredoxin fold domain-containing protein [Syntrophorhabdales bacterium]|nr:thioredoxin fold domain-containing protein [Syntrophorhabdales bacterium]